jgi:hypothetical protein
MEKNKKHKKERRNSCATTKQLAPEPGKSDGQDLHDLHV